MMIKLTKEHLKKFRTTKGGLTGVCMDILAGTRKPIQGWFKRSLGKEISQEDCIKILNDIDRIEKERITNPNLRKFRRWKV